MTELERHIVALLLDNDCVIVPGFGGFMTHHIAAIYNENNNVFIPPSRTIGFNQRLTMNDSLLAQSYVNTYEISYPEALKQIEQDVEYLKQQIEADGYWAICGIGKIIVVDNGTYDFVPEASGIISPDIYGFEPFEINTLELSEEEKSDQVVITNEDEFDIKKEDFSTSATTLFSHNTTNAETTITASVKKEEEKENKQETEKKEIALRIPINVIKHIAAACVMLFVFLSIPSRLGDSSTSLLKQSSIDTSLLYEIMPKDMISGKPDSLRSIKQDSTFTERQTTKTQEIITHVESSDKDTFYSIVLASRINKRNAKEYVEKLHQNGMVEASVHSSNGMTKVIYKKFRTRQEATKAMKSINGHNGFEGCWITEIK